jgi:hypothetical protein
VKYLIEKFCGVDVHRDLLVATILNGDTQEKQTRRFQNDPNDIDKIREWLKINECRKAVMESTSIYWFHYIWGWRKQALKSPLPMPIKSKAYRDVKQTNLTRNGLHTY